MLQSMGSQRVRHNRATELNRKFYLQIEGESEIKSMCRYMDTLLGLKAFYPIE